MERLPKDAKARRMDQNADGNIADDLDCDLNNAGFGDSAISPADLVIVYRTALGLLPAIYN